MLTDKDYSDAAKIIGCEPDIIKAVTKVEAPRGAYDDEGHITMLFEPYQFYKELKAASIDPTPLISQYPTLVSDHWNPSLYGKYSDQYNKLQGAANICATCAYKATSFGLFQILGTNAVSIGYKDVYEMYTLFVQSEYNQLIGFIKFVVHNHLSSYLVNKDWDSFALHYNGADYKKNNYPEKLEKAYADIRS